MSRGSLFKEKLSDLQEKLEEKMVEEFASNPILHSIREECGKSVDRLASERDNFEEDANASSRIKAADSLLNRAGYVKPEDQKERDVIIVALSEEKLSKIREAQVGGKIPAQPDKVQG